MLKNAWMTPSLKRGRLPIAPAKRSRTPCTGHSSLSSSVRSARASPQRSAVKSATVSWLFDECRFKRRRLTDAVHFAAVLGSTHPIHYLDWALQPLLALDGSRAPNTLVLLSRHQRRQPLAALLIQRMATRSMQTPHGLSLRGIVPLRAAEKTPATSSHRKTHIKQAEVYLNQAFTPV
jgi:hypothetical protein